MNKQLGTDPQRGRRDTDRLLLGGEVLRIESWPGQLTVVDGRVWLTRRGDGNDHVLHGGQHIAVSGRDGVVLEAWDGAGATVRWQPAAQALPRAGFAPAAWPAGVMRRFALGLAAAAGRFAAAARNAASSASRAQGRICSGESMACGGTVQ